MNSSTCSATPQLKPGYTQGSRPINDANRLGLDFESESECFAFDGPIHDVHTHISSVAAAEVFFETADWYGIDRVWTMTGLPNVDALTEVYGPRLKFIAVPDFANRDQDLNTFTSSFLSDLEGFYERGCKICKFWVAPRGLDFTDVLRLDHPELKKVMVRARDLGMMFMTHVADPDTWFATKYADASKYGTKAEHYDRLEAMLDEFSDLTVIGAHMGGSPEDLDFLQGLLDRHPNYVIDTSATKWIVREISKHPQRFAEFCQRNVGRVLFGTDIVANNDNVQKDWNEGSGGHDLYASRFWALRTLMQSNYQGLSPIVDPDLHMVDESVDPKSTATLRGSSIEGDALREMYRDAAERLLKPLYGKDW